LANTELPTKMTTGETNIHLWSAIGGSVNSSSWVWLQWKQSIQSCKRWTFYQRACWHMNFKKIETWSWDAAGVLGTICLGYQMVPSTERECLSRVWVTSNRHGSLTCSKPRFQPSWAPFIIWPLGIEPRWDDWFWESIRE
jgi:hypothetical protein